jgi:hypothetical protein
MVDNLLPRPKNKWGGIENAAYSAMGLAPIVYNTIRSGQKTKYLNPNDYMVNQPVEALRTSSNEQIQQARALASNVLNNPNVSSAERVAALNQLHSVEANINQQVNNTNAQAYSTAQQTDLQRKMTNAQIGLNVEGINMQSEANRRNMLSAAMSQLSQYGQGQQKTKNQKIRDAQMVEQINKAFDDYERGEDGKWYWKKDKNKANPMTFEDIFNKEINKSNYAD